MKIKPQLLSFKAEVRFNRFSRVEDKETSLLLAYSLF